LNALGVALTYAIVAAAAGTVVDLVSAERVSDFNVEEAGVMIKSAPFGLLFIPISLLPDEGIVFVKRGET
jgi:hypothetical protein